ncbi:MAG: ankyrin repeat domain-containing protein [Ramlibacter sp.]
MNNAAAAKASHPGAYLAESVPAQAATQAEGAAASMPSPLQAWFQAVADGAISDISALLQVDPKLVHAAGPDGRAAIHVAVDEGSPALIRLLRAHGALATQRVVDTASVAPGQVGAGGCSALTAAVEKGADEQVLRALVEPTVSQPAAGIDTPDGRGHTALTLAIQASNTHRTACLIRLGASLWAADGNSRTPLRLAIRQNDSAMIEMLRNAAAATRKAQLEFLRAAANEGQATLFLSLWKAFPQPPTESRSVNDWLLQVTVTIGCEAAVKDVLAKGTGVNARGAMIEFLADRGGAALMAELMNEDHSSIPADRRAVALERAIARGDRACLELMLSHGWTCPARQADLLGTAVRTQGREIIDLLLDYMSPTPDTIRAALAEAVQWSREEALDRLLARTSEPEIECGGLLAGAPSGAAVRMLLQHGAGGSANAEKVFGAARVMATRGHAFLLEEVFKSESANSFSGEQLGAIEAAARQAAALSNDPREFNAVFALLERIRG